MKRKVTIPLALLLVGAFATMAFAASDEERAKELQKERTKLEKETDPVDRAKIAIKISDILVEEVGDSVREGNFTEMETELAAYAKTIEAAHKTLVDS